MYDQIPRSTHSLRGELTSPEGVLHAPGSPQTIGLKETDVLLVQAHWLTLLRNEDTEIQMAGETLLERIAHPNWSVEWNLPRWLGVRVGLSDYEQQQLVLANVAGLGYIRLADDARDGESQSPGSNAASALERILFEASKSGYRDLVGGDAWFWAHFESCLEVWRRAALPRQMGNRFPQNFLDDNQGLEDFGAPLFICCAAASLLAGDRESYDSLAEPVRHYLRAAVVYDHFKDWTQDLQAGRDNLFVRAQTGGQSMHANPEAARREVEMAMIDGRSMGAYIQRIRMELNRAVITAQVVGMPVFALHLAGLENEITRSGNEMLEEISNLLDHAVGVLKGEAELNRIR